MMMRTPEPVKTIASKELSPGDRHSPFSTAYSSNGPDIHSSVGGGASKYRPIRPAASPSGSIGSAHKLPLSGSSSPAALQQQLLWKQQQLKMQLSVLEQQKQAADARARSAFTSDEASRDDLASVSTSHNGSKISDQFSAPSHPFAGSAEFRGMPMALRHSMQAAGPRHLPQTASSQMAPPQHQSASHTVQIPFAEPSPSGTLFSAPWRPDFNKSLDVLRETLPTSPATARSANSGSSLTPTARCKHPLYDQQSPGQYPPRNDFFTRYRGASFDFQDGMSSATGSADSRCSSAESAYDAYSLQEGGVLSASQWQQGQMNLQRDIGQLSQSFEHQHIASPGSVPGTPQSGMTRQQHMDHALRMLEGCAQPQGMGSSVHGSPLRPNRRLRIDPEGNGFSRQSPLTAARTPDASSYKKRSRHGMEINSARGIGPGFFSDGDGHDLTREATPQKRPCSASEMLEDDDGGPLYSNSPARAHSASDVLQSGPAAFAFPSSRGMYQQQPQGQRQQRHGEQWETPLFSPMACRGSPEGDDTSRTAAPIQPIVYPSPRPSPQGTPSDDEMDGVWTSAAVPSTRSATSRQQLRSHGRSPSGFRPSPTSELQPISSWLTEGAITLGHDDHTPSNANGGGGGQEVSPESARSSSHHQLPPSSASATSAEAYGGMQMPGSGRDDHSHAEGDHDDFDMLMLGPDWETDLLQSPTQFNSLSPAANTLQSSQSSQGMEMPPHTMAGTLSSTQPQIVTTLSPPQTGTQRQTGGLFTDRSLMPQSPPMPSMGATPTGGHAFPANDDLLFHSRSPAPSMDFGLNGEPGSVLGHGWEGVQTPRPPQGVPGTSAEELTQQRRAQHILERVESEEVDVDDDGADDWLHSWEADTGSHDMTGHDGVALEQFEEIRQQRRQYQQAALAPSEARETISLMGQPRQAGGGDHERAAVPSSNMSTASGASYDRASGRFEQTAAAIARQPEQTYFNQHQHQHPSAQRPSQHMDQTGSPAHGTVSTSAAVMTYGYAPRPSHSQQMRRQLSDLETRARLLATHRSSATDTSEMESYRDGVDSVATSPHPTSKRGGSIARSSRKGGSSVGSGGESMRSNRSNAVGLAHGAMCDVLQTALLPCNEHGDTLQVPCPPPTELPPVANSSADEKRFYVLMGAYSRYIYRYLKGTKQHNSDYFLERVDMHDGGGGRPMRLVHVTLQPRAIDAAHVMAEAHLTMERMLHLFLSKETRKREQRFDPCFEWLLRNIHFPYPGSDAIDDVVRLAGLDESGSVRVSASQARQWFRNKRRMQWVPPRNRFEQYSKVFAEFDLSPAEVLGPDSNRVVEKRLAHLTDEGQ